MELYNKNSCCGCGLCELICPQKAIKLAENENGFKYPIIDKNKCTNCGACKKICAFNNNTNNMNVPQKCYAARNKDDYETKNSASGGIFFALAKQFINDGGYVCGSVMEYNMKSAEVKHILSNKLEDIRKMQGSKYVQSSILEVIPIIKEILNQGKKVLFTGTPCQCATIKKYFANFKNLYTIDIICHGVPSIKLFNDFLDYELDKNDRIIDFCFRDKSIKKGFISKMTIGNKSKIKYIYKPAYLNSYYRLFLESYTYRESCYSCPFAQEKRVSDITIGDYWGIQNDYKKEIEGKIIDINKTWSAVMINNNIGEELFEKYGKNITKLDAEYDNIRKGNKQLNYPSKRQNERDLLFNLYKKCGYKGINQFYVKKIGRIKYSLLKYRFKFLKY